MKKWTLILALLGVVCSEDATVEPEPPRPAEIAVTPESGELVAENPAKSPNGTSSELPSV